MCASREGGCVQVGRERVHASEEVCASREGGGCVKVDTSILQDS